jgi:HD-GYP domain-containing protein (c-di-GMP phosphodiesterase class II)
MTSTRAYRSTLSVGDALRELESCAGTQFDPAVVEVLVACAPVKQWPPLDPTAGVAPRSG